MAFLNIPLKSIQVNVSSILGTETMPWYNPLLYPLMPPAVTPAPTPKDFRWSMVMDVLEQQHSSYITRDPGQYNGQDISVGQWIGNLTTGQAWQIISINSKTTTRLECIVQDIYRYNTFRDPSQVGNGAPIGGTYVVFSIGDTGIPEIDPVPPAGTSASFGINIQSRFQYINLQYDYPLYQEGNIFNYNDTIAADQINHKFVLSDAINRMVIGRVTSVSDTVQGWFTINPVQKIVDYLDYLPGDIGDVIYASLSVPGGITTEPGGSELYIKLRNNTSSVSYSTLSGPTIPGTVFQINNVDVTPLSPYDIVEVETAVNLVTPETGVVASIIMSTTTVETDSGLISPAYGEPALWASSLPATSTINGIPVTFNVTSSDPGYEDYARAADMASVINAANIPDVTASVPNLLVLLLTNSSGGPITIINDVPDINGVSFAGTDSGSGLQLSTSSSTTSLLKFTAIDARPINFLDVIGTAIEDFGLVSVENGIKACGLYIEEGLRTATSTVVSNLTQLNALSPLIGDQAYVIDSNDGNGNNVDEWSLWLFDGVSWVGTSNQDSSATDAKSLEYTITIDSPSDIVVGGPDATISTGRRITLITVEVLTSFNGPATLSIGYQVNNPSLPLPVPDGLMISGVIDLGIAGTYTTSTDVLFGTDTEDGDVTITATFASGFSTEGVAQIIVSYV